MSDAKLALLKKILNEHLEFAATMRKRHNNYYDRLTEFLQSRFDEECKALKKPTETPPAR